LQRAPVQAHNVKHFAAVEINNTSNPSFCADVDFMLSVCSVKQRGRQETVQQIRRWQQLCVKKIKD